MGVLIFYYFSGEMMAIRVLRGVLGACFMTVIALYCVVVVVVQPAQEDGRILITEYRYTKSDAEVKSLVEKYGAPTWNIIATLPVSGPSCSEYTINLTLYELIKAYFESWSPDSSYPSLHDIVNAINASILDDGPGAFKIRSRSDDVKLTEYINLKILFCPESLAVLFSLVSCE